MARIRHFCRTVAGWSSKGKDFACLVAAGNLVIFFKACSDFKIKRAHRAKQQKVTTNLLRSSLLLHFSVELLVSCWESNLIIIINFYF